VAIRHITRDDIAHGMVAQVEDAKTIFQNKLNLENGLASLTPGKRIMKKL
jgi:hypothetical protein